MDPSTPTSSSPSTPESFEHAVAELEQIVQRMEGGALSLEESLEAYRRGASLVSWCRKSLADVQQQVRILEAGLLEPFESEDGQPAPGAAARAAETRSADESADDERDR